MQRERDLDVAQLDAIDVQAALRRRIGGRRLTGRRLTGRLARRELLEVVEVTPPLLKESAYGLGATTWEVMFKVVLPYTRAGVVGGIMLGLGRALGETMAVTFVIGNSQRLSSSLFAPGTTIASTLANEFGEAADLHLSTLFALGFLLFVITFVVLSVAKIMLIRAEKAKGSKT